MGSFGEFVAASPAKELRAGAARSVVVPGRRAWGVPSNPRHSTGKGASLKPGGLSDGRERIYISGLAVTDKGFLSFAAEKSEGSRQGWGRESEETVQ